MIKIPVNTISLTYNVESIIINPINPQWLKEQLDNCTIVHNHFSTMVYVLQKDDLTETISDHIDITAKLHIIDAIENILKTYAGCTDNLPMLFTEAFIRVAGYRECIAVYTGEDYSVCYHLKYSGGIKNIVGFNVGDTIVQDYKISYVNPIKKQGEAIGNYLQSLYKFKSRGSK